MDQSKIELSCFQWSLITAFLLIVMAVIMARDGRAVTEGSALPDGATNVVVVGKGWYEFTYKNQRFLYHHYKNINDMSECLTVIENKGH